MTKQDYLKLLVEDIHSTTIATIGADGHPQTRVIDMMLSDEQGVYFLTAKGKAFYAQLMEQGYIALSATKDKISISLRGKIRNIGSEKLDEIFEKNTYMQSIYPGDTHSALDVFCLYEADGEYFDISDPAHIVPGQLHHRQSGAGNTGLLCRRRLHRLQAVLFRLPPEVHRHYQQACGHRPAPLSPLRAVCGNLPQAGYRKEVLTMNQSEKRLFLIQSLLKENPAYRDLGIPADTNSQRQLLRGLMNLRAPQRADADFLQTQDAYLQGETAAKGITDAADLAPMQPGLYLWQGDITTLQCDAIVNAANSGMTGCYIPNHRCIDNAIHTFAGVELRLACAELMEQQGYPEPTGRAKITPAFNLPCRYVLHTVGPIIDGRVTKADKELLASCYRSCLALAAENNLESVAFCCISTGEFHFPNDLAAQIAVETVKQFMNRKTSVKKVIFNVFKDLDKAIYEKLLRAA